MSNYTKLPATDGDCVVVVVETVKGSRTKLAYDGRRECFAVKKLLPEGMSFPFDYGFIPSTLGDDGDPLDIILLLDDSVPAGTFVPSRLIGVIEAKQTESDGTSDENDRLLAVASDSLLYRDITKVSDLPGSVVKQIERFFVAYNAESGKKFEPKGRHGPKRAQKCLERGMRKFRRRKTKR